MTTNMTLPELIAALEATQLNVLHAKDHIKALREQLAELRIEETNYRKLVAESLRERGITVARKPKAAKPDKDGGDNA